MFGEIDFGRWKRCNEEEKCLLQPTCRKLVSLRGRRIYASGSEADDKVPVY